MLDNLIIISAGAGSGKTYRLTQEMVKRLEKGEVRAAGIIATTFTRKAAAELQERVRVALLAQGMTAQADELANALIGTVHGLGVKLLQRFAYEAGVSPAVSILAEEDQQLMFNEALATVLTLDKVQRMDVLIDRLGLRKRNEEFDWRRQVRDLVEIARANNFSAEDLLRSQQRSFSELEAFLPPVSPLTTAAFYDRFDRELAATIDGLPATGDATKKTESLISLLRQTAREHQQRGYLPWHVWAKLAKAAPGVKSKDAYADFQAFCWEHEAQQAFRDDIRDYIEGVFQTAIAAIQEFAEYKKSRGLIDYTDMEVLVNQLLDNKHVQEILRRELDLLMVDEFQDTSPLQLAVFLKLSALARQSIWVGDPKQSIYGFRGAEPRLMQAIIEQTGGLRPENIQQHSWRSREDIVHACNAVFTQAFAPQPAAEIALQARRSRAGNDDFSPESAELGQALIHWHFVPEDEGKLPSRDWMNRALAEALQEWIKTRPIICSKDGKQRRPVQAGDIAILCRSNRECEAMAQALHQAGIAAAIARTGLLQTAEAQLVMACLKYILQREDSLSVAELLLLAGDMRLEEIVTHRLDYLEEKDAAAIKYNFPRWAADQPLIGQLDRLRERAGELSGAEMLNLVLELLDLRRTIVAWGRVEQRLANIDRIRKMSLEYEERCNRLHTAASLGGLLLWFSDQQARSEDYQGAAEDPGAVNILTYHRSKGLEWPVVICHSLEQDLRADVFGFSLVADDEKIDLKDILANRYLRFWVNPYADQDRATPLRERLDGSTIHAGIQAQALEEEKRLLYVGLTRARDYLVFPGRNKAMGWLNRVCQNGNSEATTLDEHTHDTPWGWQEVYLEKWTRIYPYPRTFTQANRAETAVAFLAERPGMTAPAPPFYINAADWQENPARRHQFFSYHRQGEIPEGVDAYVLGKARKAFLTADQQSYAPAIREKMAADILQRYQLAADIPVAVLVEQSTAWQQWYAGQWPGEAAVRLLPVRHELPGQRFSAVLDWVFVRPAEVAIIQNSAYRGEQFIQKKLPELATFLQLAKAALEAAGRGPVSRTLIHLINDATVVEVFL